MLAKILNLVKSGQYHIFLGVCIILVSVISYNLGRISINGTPTLKISEGANIYQASTVGEGEGTSPSASSGPSAKTTPKPLDMRVVVSKASDSKKYHYTWCGSWKKIKPENQLWFNSDKEAEVAGYTLAGNCSK